MKKPTAHEVVKPAIEELSGRIRAAAGRVVDDQSDPEAIHDFRVGMRRLRTVLGAARDLYGKKRTEKLVAELKRFGDATSALRDEEVLEETLAATGPAKALQKALTQWMAERATRERGLRRSAIALISGDELAATLKALDKLMRRGPRADLGLSSFAEQQLAKARRGVSKMLPIAREDREGLHRLRIRFKRLRYTGEMLGGFMTSLEGVSAKRAKKAAGQTDYAELTRLAARMQKELGLLHDADQALLTVAAASDLDGGVRAKVLDGLAALRIRLVDSSMLGLEQLPTGFV